MDQKILVVDDSKTVCQAAKLAFTGSPYSVDVAHTAADALRMLRSSDYAGAIIDYVLPDQSGIDLLKAIREDQGLRPLPVVILHGSYYPFDPAEARAAGADALLVKPFLTDEILSEISNAIASAPNRPVSGNFADPASTPAEAVPVADEEASDDFDIIAEGEPVIEYQTPPPAAAVVPPPAPPAGAFRRVTPAPTPVADAPPAPRRPPLPPPPPSPLRGGFVPPPPPSRMPASARPAVPTTEVNTTGAIDPLGQYSAAADELRTTRQVDAVIDSVEPVAAETPSVEQAAITEPVSAPDPMPSDEVQPAAEETPEPLKSESEPESEASYSEHTDAAPGITTEIPPASMSEFDDSHSEDTEAAPESEAEGEASHSEDTEAAPESEAEGEASYSEDTEAAPEITTEIPPASMSEFDDSHSEDTEAAPESAPEGEASYSEELETAAAPAPEADPAPAATAPAPNVTVEADPEMVKALVRELLPGIVKEFLSSMLRQTGEKLENYSQAKIDAYVEQELPTIARKAIDEALAGIVGEE